MCFGEVPIHTLKNLCGLVSEKFKSFGDFYKNCIFGNWTAITFCSGNWNSAIFPPTLQSVSAFAAPAHKCSSLFSVTALIVRPVSCFHLNPLIITAHFLPSTTKTLAASELNELNFEPRKLVETNAGCVKEQLQRISPYTFWKEVVRQCCVHWLFDACMCPKNSWRRFKVLAFIDTKLFYVFHFGLFTAVVCRQLLLYLGYFLLPWSAFFCYFYIKTLNTEVTRLSPAHYPLLESHRLLTLLFSLSLSGILLLPSSLCSSWFPSPFLSVRLYSFSVYTQFYVAQTVDISLQRFSHCNR